MYAPFQRVKLPEQIYTEKKQLPAAVQIIIELNL